MHPFRASRASSTRPFTASVATEAIRQAEPTRPALHVLRLCTRFALVPLLAWIALSAWAVSSPVGSSPDEPYHLSSIWCGQGAERGVCETTGRAGERKVPEVLLQASCFAFHADESAACQNTWFVHESRALAPTDALNVRGDYPPLFYFTMHFFVGTDVSRSVVAMRIANAALFVGLLTATYWLLPRRRRIMLLLGATVALVPLGVFVISSVNPSSWAVIAAAILFSSVVGFFETTGRRRIALACLAVVAAAMGSGARADAAIYAALASVLATFMTVRWRRKIPWRSLALPLFICVIAGLGYLSAAQSSAAVTGLKGYTTQGSFRTQLINDVLNVPSLWAGVFGSWGLGWFDTNLPAVVWVFGLATFGAVVYAGLSQTGPKKLIATMTVLAAVWAMPTVVLLQSHASVGQGVQPRYLLPLLVLLAEVALFRVGERPQVSRMPLFLASLALTVTNAVALHINFQRYLTGTDVVSVDLDHHREWWWNIPISPMSVWVLGSVACGAALWLAARTLLRQQTRPQLLQASPAVSAEEELILTTA